MSRIVNHALLAVILLAASPLRAICADSCVADADVVQPSGHEGPVCHEPDDTAPPTDPESSDDGCRHGDDSPARGLQAAPKPVDVSPGAQAVVHVARDGMYDVAPMTSRTGAAGLRHVAPAPMCFLTPLRI